MKMLSSRPVADNGAWLRTGKDDNGDKWACSMETGQTDAARMAADQSNVGTFLTC